MQLNNCVYAQAKTVRVSLIQTADHVSLQTTPTIAAGDFQVSIDGGALANLATLPTEEPAGSGIVKLELSAEEMRGDEIVVRWVDQADDEWDPGYVTLYTDAAAMLSADLRGGTFAEGTVGKALRGQRAMEAGTRRIITSGGRKFEEVLDYDRATVEFTRECKPATGGITQLVEHGDFVLRLPAAATVSIAGYDAWIGPLADPSAGAITVAGQNPTLPVQVGPGAISVVGQNVTAGWV
jgi:hypothetical protein